MPGTSAQGTSSLIHSRKHIFRPFTMEETEAHREEVQTAWGCVRPRPGALAQNTTQIPLGLPPQLPGKHPTGAGRPGPPAQPPRAGARAGVTAEAAQGHGHFARRHAGELSPEPQTGSQATQGRQGEGRAQEPTARFQVRPRYPLHSDEAGTDPEGAQPRTPGLRGLTCEASPFPDTHTKEQRGLAAREPGLRRGRGAGPAHPMPLAVPAQPPHGSLSDVETSSGWEREGVQARLIGGCHSFPWQLLQSSVFQDRLRLGLSCQNTHDFRAGYLGDPGGVDVVGEGTKGGALA